MHVTHVCVSHDFHTTVIHYQSCSVQNCLTFAENCLNCMLAINDQKVGLSGNNCSSNCPNITFVGTSSNIQGVCVCVCVCVCESDYYHRITFVAL